MHTFLNFFIFLLFCFFRFLLFSLSVYFLSDGLNGCITISVSVHVNVEGGRVTNRIRNQNRNQNRIQNRIRNIKGKIKENIKENIKRSIERNRNSSKDISIIQDIERNRNRNRASVVAYGKFLPVGMINNNFVSNSVICPFNNNYNYYSYSFIKNKFCRDYNCGKVNRRSENSFFLFYKTTQIKRERGKLCYPENSPYYQNNPYSEIFRYRENSCYRENSRYIEKFRLAGSLNDYLYKLLIKRFKRKKESTTDSDSDSYTNSDSDSDSHTDTEKEKEKEKINIYKNLKSPKSSYTIDLLFSCRYSISDIKKKLLEYSYELKLIGTTNIKVLYLGKRKLVRPIKKEEEAYYILFSLHVYPSLIKQIYDKLMQQTEVLRFIIIKNKLETKQMSFSEDEHTKKWIDKIEQSFFKKTSERSKP